MSISASILSNPAAAAAYRDVRAAVQLANYRVVLVTAPRTAIQSGSLAVNLAVSLAQSGRSTRLIDAVGQLGSGNGAGVLNVLAGEAVEPQSTDVEHLLYWPLGHRMGHPADGLMRRGWDVVVGEAEAVVIHAPAVLDDATTLWLAKELQAAVIVGVQKGKAKRMELSAVKEKLTAQGIQLLGAVFIH